jgi:hypothetical protein
MPMEEDEVLLVDSVVKLRLQLFLFGCPVHVVHKHRDQLDQVEKQVRAASDEYPGLVAVLEAVEERLDCQHQTKRSAKRMNGLHASWFTAWISFQASTDLPKYRGSSGASQDTNRNFQMSQCRDAVPAQAASSIKRVVKPLGISTSDTNSGREYTELIMHFNASSRTRELHTWPSAIARKASSACNNPVSHTSVGHMQLLGRQTSVDSSLSMPRRSRMNTLQVSKRR